MRPYAYPISHAAIALAALCAVTQSGCATIIHGHDQTVEVRSAPEGATVVVDGRNVGVTPLSTDLRRGKPHVVEVSKDGYLTETVMTTTKANSTTALNAVIGGGAGLLIDFATGAATNVTPNAIAVNLPEAIQPPSRIRPAQYQPPSSGGQVRVLQ